MQDGQPNYEIIEDELALIWQGHHAVGLDGKMSLYTMQGQEPWRVEEEGLNLWFGADETGKAVDFIKQHYNEGRLPNSPLLLNPVLHEVVDGQTPKEIGSGIVWCTALGLGVSEVQHTAMQRVHDLGLLASHFSRADNPEAGLKVLGFSDKALRVDQEDALAPVIGAIYALTDIKSDQYFPFYLLSGLNYLSTHGMFMHEDVAQLVPDENDIEAIVAKHKLDTQKVLEAAQCWEAYERQHSLYTKFGTDPADIERNVQFYEMCARDIKLFDATGPMRQGADEQFEFIVPGLVPRGSITLLAGSGGTGKSSIAHHLCVLAATDYAEDEEPPTWLGQPLDLEKCKGLCIYFSGEDGPAIINARGSLFDPDNRAKRLMFQRTDFGEDVSFGAFLSELHKLPEVPLIVIDPARKYLTGDENDADVVSEFFEAIEEFAIEKKAAIIVVHHLQKGANPQSARQVLEELRGSQVFIDRPRVVIGLFRDGKYTIAGLAKNNIPPNMGMVADERVFARDPEKLQLVWLPGEKGIRRVDPTPEELEQIQAEKELKDKQAG